MRLSSVASLETTGYREGKGDAAEVLFAQPEEREGRAAGEDSADCHPGTDGALLWHHTKDFV